MNTTATLDYDVLSDKGLGAFDSWLKVSLVDIANGAVSETCAALDVVNLYGTTSDEQSWFWTAEWQSEELEATMEIEKNQLSPKLFTMEEISEYLSNI